MNVNLDSNTNIVIGATAISQKMNGVPVIDGGNNNITVKGVAIVNGEFIDGTKKEVCIKTFEESFDVKTKVNSISLKILNTTSVVVKKGEKLAFKYYGIYKEEKPIMDKIVLEDSIRINIGKEKENYQYTKGTLEISIPYDLDMLDIFSVFRSVEIKDELRIKNLKVNSTFGNINVISNSETVNVESEPGNIAIYSTAEKIKAKSISGDIEIMPVGEKSVDINISNNVGDTGISVSYNKTGFSNVEMDIAQLSCVSKVRNRAVLNTESDLSLKVTGSTVSGNVYID